MDKYLDELSAGTPVPGGGSVAALQVAMGAALVAMVANLTIGKKRYVDVQDAVMRARDVALSTRDEAHGLAKADEAAYAEVARAMAMPRSTESEKAARHDALQYALKAATRPPLQTMRLAVRVIELSAQLVEIGNRNAVSDVGSAAASALAGFQSACLNVETNLQAVKDIEWRTATARTLDGVPGVQDLAARVLQRTQQLIRGEVA